MLQLQAVEEAAAAAWLDAGDDVLLGGDVEVELDLGVVVAVGLVVDVAPVVATDAVEEDAD